MIKFKVLERILIVSSTYKPEPGVSAMIGESLAKTLSERGHHVTVVAPYPSRPHGYNFESNLDRSKKSYKRSKDNFDLFRLPSYTYSGTNPIYRLWESVSFGWVIYKYIKTKRKDFDKIYMNTWPIFGQLGVAKASRDIKIPYYVHIQDVYPESFTNKLPFFLKRLVYHFLFPIERYVVKNAKTVVVISETMKQLIASTRKISTEKIRVIINWQDYAAFEKATQPVRDEKFTFMYLGNIGPVAGIPFLINAFAKSGVNARLIIAGSGSSKKESINLAKLFPEAEIEFMDVPAGKVAEVQSRADVLILPIIKGAASSSIPSKLPAYMFSAKPILACVDSESETEKSIKDAKCGWVIGPGDEAKLIGKLQSIVKISKFELEQLGINAREYGRSYFSKETCLPKLADIIIS